MFFSNPIGNCYLKWVIDSQAIGYEEIHTNMKKNISELASVAFFGFLLGGALKYGIEIIIARGLGPAGLGIFSFGLMIIHAAGMFARGGLDQAAIKYIPIYNQNDDQQKIKGIVYLCLGGAFLIGAILSILIFIVFDLAGLAIVSKFGPNVKLFLLGVPLFAVMSVGAYATRGFKETKYSVYVQSVGQPSLAILLIIFAIYFVSGIKVVIIGYLLSLVFGVFLATYFIHILADLSWETGPEFEVRKIVAFSLPLMLIAVFRELMSWIDVFMLGLFTSPGTIGLYQAGFRTAAILGMISGAVDAIFPSITSEYYYTNQTKRLENTFKTITKWLSYFTLLGYSFLAIFSNEILSVFGSTFVKARIALLIMGFSQLIISITGPSGYLLVMSEYERLNMANTIVFSVVNIGLNYIFIQKYGFVGAAFATGISLSLLNLVQVIEVQLLLGFHPYNQEYWKGIFATFSVLPVMLGAHRLPFNIWLKIFISGILSISVFIFVLWQLGLEENDKLLLQSIE